MANHKSVLRKFIIPCVIVSGSFLSFILWATLLFMAWFGNQIRMVFLSFFYRCFNVLLSSKKAK